jgi:hypothetical protein
MKEYLMKNKQSNSMQITSTTAKEQLLVDLEADQTFLDTAFKAASKELRKKFDKKNANCEILKALNWDVVECNSLIYMVNTGREVYMVCYFVAHQKQQ